jgi:hypothetical protein
VTGHSCKLRNSWFEKLRIWLKVIGCAPGDVSTGLGLETGV